MGKQVIVRAKNRLKRKARVRKSLKTAGVKTRLSVFRSLKYTYAQFVDESGKVITGSSTKTLSAEGKSSGSVEAAKVLGAKMAELAKEKKIEEVVFDRNGYLYHGRVAAVAEGARDAGLKF